MALGSLICAHCVKYLSRTREVGDRWVTGYFWVTANSR